MSAVGRITRHAQNLLEVARYGGLHTGEEPAEFEIVDRGPDHRLRHYALGLPADAPSVLLVPPLMVSTEVFDVSPPSSAVRTLAALGVQSWVVDFGSPEHEPGGLERTFEDHVLAVDQSISYVRDATAHAVHIGGYSQGGMFCYQAAAYRRSKGVASITVFGSPVDVAGSADLQRASCPRRCRCPHGWRRGRTHRHPRVDDAHGLPGTRPHRCGHRPDALPLGAPRSRGTAPARGTATGS